MHNKKHLLMFFAFNRQQNVKKSTENIAGAAILAALACYTAIFWSF